MGEFMRRIVSAILAAWLLAAPVMAQPSESVLNVGGDRFAAGKTVDFNAIEGIDDLFLAGEVVRVSSAPGGSAHLVGRRLRIGAPVPDALYAAGFDVELDAPVQGDVTLFGYTVEIRGAVGGDLRAGGSDLTLAAPVSGYALLTGEHVQISAAISGDAVVTARRVEFRDGARVDGALTLYVPDPDDVTVPETVATADRVTVQRIEDFEHGGLPGLGDPRPSIWTVLGSFVGGVIVVGLAAALALALAPDRVRAWRKLALARPGRALLSGFVLTSALAGSGLVLALTLVGILLIPPILLITGLILFAGYVLGVYVLGAGVWQGFGKTIPDSFPGRFGIAALGAVLTGIAALVPILGWLFVMGLTLLGVGVLGASVLPRQPLLNRADAL